MRALITRLFDRLFPSKAAIALNCFNSWHYQRHNARRLEHLASLGLALRQRRVLEVGAGIGDHTHFYLDRQCQVVTTEARKENFELLERRYPKLETHRLDLDNPQPVVSGLFDVIHCYGVLYHLKRPSEALQFLAPFTRDLMLVETCVSYGDEDLLYPCSEVAEDATQAISGVGCRPTRRWVYNRLKNFFDFVYLPITQPCHEEFPLDWCERTAGVAFTRAIFVASRTRLANHLLSTEIPIIQQHC